jgi:hypothetical protein
VNRKLGGGRKRTKCRKRKVGNRELGGVRKRKEEYRQVGEAKEWNRKLGGGRKRTDKKEKERR